MFIVSTRDNLKAKEYLRSHPDLVPRVNTGSAVCPKGSIADMDGMMSDNSQQRVSVDREREKIDILGQLHVKVSM